MQNRKQLWGSIMLLVCAIIWGSGFVVMKEALDGFTVAWLLASRFLGGAVVLTLCFLPRLRRLNKAVIGHGLVCGALVWAAYMTQTYGLAETTPGKNAFLTAVYCVLVPFSTWLVAGRRPTRQNLLAGLLCIIGIGLISLDGGLRISRGDALTLLCGVLFAFQVTMVGLYGEHDDAVLLTLTQIWSAGLLLLFTALLTEPVPAGVTGEMWGQLLYLILLPTALTNLMQNVGQTMLNPSAAAILLSLECVFGTLCSVLLYGEQLTPRLLAGFAIVFVAVLVSQLGGRDRQSAAPAA